MIYTCAADLGFRSDSSAACVVGRDGNRYKLVDYLEKRPRAGSPLQPSIVLSSIAKLAKRHKCSGVWSDFHYSETAKEELAKEELALLLAPAGQSGKIEVFTVARQLILEGCVLTPRVPALIAQMKAIRAKPTSGGGLSIEQPRKGNSHGDLASAFVLALWAASKHPTTDWKYEHVPYNDPRHSPVPDRHRHWRSRPDDDDDDDRSDGGKFGCF